MSLHFTQLLTHTSTNKTPFCPAMKGFDVTHPIIDSVLVRKQAVFTKILTDHIGLKQKSISKFLAQH